MFLTKLNQGKFSSEVRVFIYFWILSSLGRSLFSGTLVHGVHRRLRGGQAAEALLETSPQSWQLYSALLVAARNRSSNPHHPGTTEGTTRGRGPRGRGRGRGGRGGGGGRGRGKRGANVAEAATGVEDVSNRFALLMSSDW